MTKQNLLFLVAGLLAGFIAGFFMANTMSAREAASVNPAAASAQPAPNSPGAKDSVPQLSEEDIRAAIQKTDERAADIDVQKKSGRAIYFYAVQARDPRFLKDAVRFLKRAVEADPKDRETTVLLGNALFDMGQLGEPARFAEARTYYQKALEMDANDVNVRTDLGLTYYFGEPSDPQSAIREYRKSLQIDPRHELTLQNMATALVKTGDLKEAQKTLETLRGVNPKNPAISDLESLIAQGGIKP